MSETDREMIEALKAATGRQCGECSMCCKLLDIDEPDIKKLQNVWCQHCIPGKGCGIYDNRPATCANFACQWLIDKSMPKL